MKRMICLLLPLLLAALLLGCGLLDDGETQETIPDASYDISGLVLPTDANGDPVGMQDEGPVRSVVSLQGEIPLTDPPRTYTYQLPMIDRSGAQALGCNQEIENRFLPLIEQSSDAISTLGEPVLERLTWSSYTIDGILTLEIDRLDFDGSASQAFYTVEAETGNEVSVGRLFAAAGIAGEPEQVLNRTVLDLFVSRYGALEGADAAVTTALNRTQAALSGLSANRMHLNRDGSLTVAVELYAPQGGGSVEELTLP